MSTFLYRWFKLHCKELDLNIVLRKRTGVAIYTYSHVAIRSIEYISRKLKKALYCLRPWGLGNKSQLYKTFDDRRSRPPGLSENVRKLVYQDIVYTDDSKLDRPRYCSQTIITIIAFTIARSYEYSRMLQIRRNCMDMTIRCNYIPCHQRREQF